MGTDIEQKVKEFYELAFGDYFESLSLEELKCIDWFVLDADPYIEAKNKKAA